MREFFLKIFKGLGSRGYLKFLSSKTYIKVLWYLRYGKKIDFDNPKTFNEKTQWLKLYDYKDDYDSLVDKIAVKSYIADVIGSEYIIKTLWEGTDPNCIPYDELPDKFVIKCTHGSHCSVVCKDKANLNKVKTCKKLKKWLKQNWFWYGREPVYKKLKPAIIVEEYLEDCKYKELVDYKFYCFNGIPKIVDVCTQRYSKEGMCETYMDTDWNYLGFVTVGNGCIPDFEKPKNFDLMMDIAKKLSKNYRFLRVDLYEVNGRVYFGELTFYSACGFENLSPKEWDLKIGDMLNLELTSLEE